MRDQLYCVMDYETRSKADLKLVGGYEYARHPSTRLLCVSWAIGTLEQFRRGTYTVHVWSPYLPSPYGEFKRALLNKDIILVAHNAFFEQVITRFVLPRYIHNEEIRSLPPSRWMCTASMARAVAIPGKLETAAAALALGVQKDMEGHRLMMKMSKPRKPTKNNPAVWHAKVSQLKRLMEYCKADVETEIALFLKVPRLSSSERELWLLDQEMNWRGFRVDRPLVHRSLKLIAKEQRDRSIEFRMLTQGEIQTVGQRAAILKWLKARGMALPNLQAKTVKDLLAGRGLRPECRRLLELRQALSKTSTAKFVACEARSRSDGRIRDSLVYHAASTGRFGGAGFQPHNLPKPIIPDTDYAAKVILDPDTDNDVIRLLWGNPLDVFSSCTRSAIVPSEGCEFFSGDFNGIEVRVLFWLAGHADGLRAYREDRDLYCELASVIYGKTITKADDKERDLGKRAVLGCGFGMGDRKFAITCAQWGSPIDKSLAKKAVKAYREVHAPVTQLWYNIERAAIEAVRHPGRTYKTNKTEWTFEKGFLWCKLPSGRKISYYGPRIRMTTTPWGAKKPELWHWGLNDKKQWVFSSTYGGKLTENIVQATARDLMTDKMKEAEVRGYKLVITVHDELLTERKRKTGKLDSFNRLMASGSPWAKGLPIKVGAWQGERYRK